MPRTSLELKDIVVRAGAGAGKTTDLVRRVLELEMQIWEQENRHAKLIVTTFTRKATQELKERLLAKALTMDQKILVDFVQRPSHLHISTIHGVLSIFLSRYGSALGLSPQFQILSQKAVITRAKKIFREKLQSNLEFSQRAAMLLEITDLQTLLESLLQYSSMCSLSSLRNPLRVQTADLQSLIDEKLQWVQRKAEDLMSLLRTEELNEAWSNYATGLQRQIAFKRWTLDAVFEFLETIKSPTKSKKISEILGDAKNEFQELLKEFRNYSLTPDFLKNHEKYSLDFEFIGQQFDERLSELTLKTSQLSLSDLELFSLRLFREFPKTAELFSEEWDYWMVDEYQDTSPLQVLLLKSLMGQKKSFTVGDPQQSIYLFRGARSEVFLEKESLVKSSHGECLSLMKNYRSQASLLHFFNDVCTRMNSSQFQPMEVGFSKDIKSRESEAVQILFADDSEQEVLAVITRIQELLKLDIAPEKICVLSRGNKELDLIAKEARAASIPVQVHSSSQFARRQEIRDAVALLRFFVNPSDNLSFLQCLRSPFHFVADVHLQDLAGSQAESYFVRALKKTWDPVIDLQKRLELCRTQGLIAVWKKTLKECRYFDYLQVLDSSGRKEANLWKLVSLLSAAEKTPGFSILDFLDEMTGPQVETDGDQDATPVIEPSKVNLMTVHASKGLQFEYVIIPFLGKKSPSPKAEFFLADDEGAWTLSLPEPEENRLTRSVYGDIILENRKQREALELERLFYVALTRSEMGVSLIWSKSDKGSLAARLIELGYGAFGDSEAETLDRIEDKGKYSVRLRAQKWDLQIDLKIDRESSVKAREPFLINSVHAQESRAVTEILSGEILSAGHEKTSEESLESLQKALLGVEVHRLFEGLKYQPGLESKEPKINKAVNFLKTWEKGKVLELINTGEVEWGFAISKNKWLIQGQIDLWGHDLNQNFYVVDYKTGSEKYKEKAYEQLEIYAWALRKMGHIPVGTQPTLMIIYPFVEKVLQRPATSFQVIDSILDSKSQQID